MAGQGGRRAGEKHRLGHGDSLLGSRFQATLGAEPAAVPASPHCPTSGRERLRCGGFINTERGWGSGAMVHRAWILNSPLGGWR